MALLTWQKLLLLSALASLALGRPQSQTDREPVDWHMVPLIAPEHRSRSEPGGQTAPPLAAPASEDPPSSSVSHANPSLETRRARIDAEPSDTSPPSTSPGTSISSSGTSTSSSPPAGPPQPQPQQQQQQTRVVKKATPIIGDSIKKLANQLLVQNATEKNRKKPDQSEQKAHMGVAVPMTMEELEKELSKAPHMTTSSGLSTWVLLSGGHSTTTPKNLAKISDSSTTMKKPKPTAAAFMKTGRPVITMVTRREQQVTPKPGNTTTRLTVHSSPLLTKVKASVLADTLRNKSAEAAKTDMENVSTSTKSVTKRTTRVPVPTTTTRTTTASRIEETTPIAVSDMFTTFSSVESKEGGMELIESREAATTKKPKRDNAAQTNSNKRKKPNKNRRRPANSADGALEVESKVKNSTKTALAKKPISTQIYNYLSREVMPTVGVGLVGLMVTAGLTYFLYPFGGLRRSYNVLDRKDDLYSYGADELANADGQSEEEVFGKVIAGMPTSQLYPNVNINQPAYGNNRQQIYNRQNVPQQKMPIQPKRPVYRNLHPVYSRQGHVYPEPIGYNTHDSAQVVDVQQRNVEEVEIDAKPSEVHSDSAHFEPMTQTTLKSVVTPSTTTKSIIQPFVVGNVPKELLEPSSVPEHGPRRRRDTEDISDNEIIPVTGKYSSEENSDESSSEETSNTTAKPKEIINIIEHQEVPANKSAANSVENNLIEGSQVTNSTETNGGKVDETPEYHPVGGSTNIVDFIKQLIHFKLRLGLGLLQRTTEVLSRYLRGTSVVTEMSTPRRS